MDLEYYPEIRMKVADHFNMISGWSRAQFGRRDLTSGGVEHHALTASMSPPLADLVDLVLDTLHVYIRLICAMLCGLLQNKRIDS